MKTPTNDIFQLIQAMSAAEKRYFKIHFSSNKSLVTELFNFLNGMKTYNEEEVKNHFKDTKLSKNLKVYKIMLMELLLKSLSSFRYKKTIQGTIRQNLEEVEILLEKNLFAQAYKKLEKTKRLCFKHEQYNLLITVLDFEYQFKSFYETFSTQDALSTLDETKSAMETIAHLFQLKKVSHELSIYAGQIDAKNIDNVKVKTQESFLLNKLKEFEKNPPILPFKYLYYTHSALGHLYHSVKNTEKEFFHKSKILDLLDKNQHLIANHPEKNWSAYFNYANCCLRTNKNQKLKVAIKVLKTLNKKHPSFERKGLLISILEIAFHRKKRNYKKVIKDLESVVLNQISLHGKNQKQSVVYAYISLMITHFALGNYIKVQFYLRRLFKIKVMGKAFHYLYETIDMISHYESGDIDILRNLLTSKKRKIKRDSNYGTPFFKILLDFFSKLIEEDKDIPQLVKELKKHAKHHAEDNFSHLMHYFIFEDWINALLVGKTYSEHVSPKNMLV